DRPFGELPENHRFHFMEAKYVADYIDRYLDDHVYAGRTLRDRIKCNFTVDKVLKLPDGTWDVSGHTTAQDQTHEPSQFQAPKLIVASGFTSEPKIPNIKNDGFAGKIIHSKTYGREASTILAEPKKRITVL